MINISSTCEQDQQLIQRINSNFNVTLLKYHHQQKCGKKNKLASYFSVSRSLKTHHAETVDFRHHADNKSEGERALSNMSAGGRSG